MQTMKHFRSIVLLAALASGMLNSFGRFFIPASTPILFNVAAIAAVATGSTAAFTIATRLARRTGVLQLGAGLLEHRGQAAGLHHARHGQKHIWHRMFFALQHRQ